MAPAGVKNRAGKSSSYSRNEFRKHLLLTTLKMTEKATGNAENSALFGVPKQPVHWKKQSKNGIITAMRTTKKRNGIP